MQEVIRVSGASLWLAAMVGLAGCASTGTQATAAKPVAVTVEVAPVAQKDALGNYRFLMQQGGANMSADQFDAWMKANGIRVAQGAPAARAATPVVDKKKRKR
ncbi:Rare lipoprotein A [uncultured Stenotrophomonas sp.]|uniref:Rare lipoprotein A n=1 Tax=uncultured Stenotrophomonas sp. TaxID=165438 RepID=A0A1Y5Q6J8_9GAMM|nr:Rare lipoprotein A [uncultured Stenotrophomonas sp.]